MPTYDPQPVIIEASFRELQKVALWVHDRGEDPAMPITVLVAGWAVDAYNPYLGSVDIDIVTNSRTKKSMMHHLQRHEGYQYHTQFPLGKTVYKSITRNDAVILDFETKRSPYRFEGYRDRPFTLDILTGNTVMIRIRESVEIAVPNRATLLFLKMKAAWDRGFRLDHQVPMISEEWERAKMVKDYADILALIDPESGGREINLEILGAHISRFPFLKSLILHIPEPEIEPAHRRYDRMSSQEITTLCRNLESVL